MTRSENSSSSACVTCRRNRDGHRTSARSRSLAASRGERMVAEGEAAGAEKGVGPREGGGGAGLLKTNKTAAHQAGVQSFGRLQHVPSHRQVRPERWAPKQPGQLVARPGHDRHAGATLQHRPPPPVARTATNGCVKPPTAESSHFCAHSLCGHWSKFQDTMHRVRKRPHRGSRHGHSNQRVLLRNNDRCKQ